MRERLYNPAHLTREELKASFIVRQQELAELLRIVHDQPKDGPLQHVLIIGARGMGKTSLGLRLLLAIDEDLVLRTQWQPVAFFEESYGVHDLASLWLTALQHLAEAVKDKRWSQRAESLRDQERDPQRLAAVALGVLNEFRQETGRRPILLVENLDEILRQFADRADTYRLRANLQERSDLLLIGTANSEFQAIAGHGEPFYEFFRALRLKGLREQETLALIEGLARQIEYSNLQRILTEGRKRVEIIRSLTGGNPRLILLASRMMAEAPTGDARQDLERLIDEQTPYFKARIESLPPQARVVFHALAAGWAPMLAREVAAQTRLSSSHASAQLKGLVSMGYVEEIRRPRERRVRYQVLERFYNIYYLLRFTHDQRRRLERLIDFLVALFETTTLPSMAKAALQRVQTGLGRTDDWMALDIILPRVARDFDVDTSSQLFREALHLCTEHEVQVPELLRQGTRFAEDDPAYRAEYIASSRKWLGAHPDDLSVWLGLTTALLDDNDPAAAADALMSSVKCEPRDPGLWALLGGALSLAGHHESAIDAYRRAIDLDPNKSDYWLAQGRQQMAMQQFDKAQESLTKAVELDCQSEAPRALFGLLLVRRNRLDEAEAALRTSLEAIPNSAKLWSELGYLYMKMNRESDSEAALGRSIEIDALKGDGFLRLGILRLKQSRPEEAETLFRQMIDLDPRNAMAWLYLASLFTIRQQADKASEAITRALSVAPGNVHVMLGAASLLLMVGNFSVAFDVIRKIQPQAVQSAIPHVMELLAAGFVHALACGHSGQIARLLNDGPLRESFEPLLYVAQEKVGEPLPPLPAELLSAVEQVRAIVTRLQRSSANSVAAVAHEDPLQRQL